MTATTFRASSPAGIAMVAFASLSVAVLILFVDFPALPISWGFLLTGVVLVYCAWPDLVCATSGWNRVDQFAWALLIGHTVHFLPGRDPRILTRDQSMTTFIMIQVGIWCLCLLYALPRLLSRTGRIANLFGPAGKYVTIFLLAAAASSFYAIHTLITLAWTLKLVAIVTVGCLLFDRQDPRGSCERFLEATRLGLLLLLLLFLCAAAITGDASQDPTGIGKVWRLGGSLLAATKLSAVTGILLLMALVEILAGRTSWRRWALCLVLTGMMLAALGRGAMLATGVASILILALFRRMRLAVVAAGIVGLVFVMVPGAAGASWEVLSRRQGFDEIASLTGRVPLWETVIDLISEKPLLGWGYVSGSRVGLVHNFWRWQAVDAHNAFLQALLTLGTVGLTVVVMLIAKILLGAWQSLRSAWDSVPLGALGLCAVKVVGLATFLLVQGLLEGGFASVPGFETGVLVGSAFCVDAFAKLRSTGS